MDGFYGRILKVDLSQKSFQIEPIADEIKETNERPPAMHRVLDCCRPFCIRQMV